MTSYTLETSDDTATVTAVAESTSATISITLASYGTTSLVGMAVVGYAIVGSETPEETEVENGADVTWITGTNVLTVTVANGDNMTVYTVTVTKS